MKNALLFLLLGFSLTTGFATTVDEQSLKELVSMSDNIWGGRIQKVRMVNSRGKEVTDPEARTGPGITNTIYLDVLVDPNLILFSSRSEIPKKISIPLWQAWHYSLGQIKELEGNHSIFLLNKDLEPAYPAGFEKALSEENKLRSLIRKLKTR